MIIALSCQAGTTAIEGDITLNYSKSWSGDGVFKKEFGDVVKANAKWHAGDFFGEETVFAGISVSNTTATKIYFHYYVAFFDKNKKLVGTASQGGTLDPAENTSLGSCLIQLPPDRYKDIVSYQALLYETDVPPKKK
jgi:hypothetical protein